MLVYLFFITFAEYVIAQEQQNNQTQPTDYKVLNLYEINQIQQANNTQSMILNLKKNKQDLANNNFLVIDIDLTFTQIPQSTFIACLNFNYDVLQDINFQNAGAYSCQYMDANATQQQISQHLIVINASDINLVNNNKAYLTIFYLEHPNDFLSESKQLKSQINYVLVTYYSSWYPCHNNCNNYNGVCNQKTGQCQCQPLYFNIDCSFQADSLNLNQNYDSVDITIYQQKTSYFFINLTQVMLNNNQSHLTLQFRQMNQEAMIGILINVNELNLPTDNQNNQRFVMSNQIMQIQNVDLLCSNYYLQNVNDTDIVNIGGLQIQNQCFLVLAMKQAMSQSQFSLIGVQLELQTSSTTYDVGNNNNQANNQNNKSQSSQLNQVQITIILVCSLSGMCVLIIILKVLKKKLKSTIQNRNLNINNLQNDVLAQDFFNFVNQHTQKDKIKQLISQKKRILQEYLMPIIKFQSSIQQSVNKIEAQQSKILVDQGKIKNEQNSDLEFKIKCNNILPSLQVQVMSPVQAGLLGHKAIQIISNCQSGSKYLDEENKDSLSQQQNQEKKVPSLSESQINGKQTCSICLIEFNSDEQIRQTICNHTFHSQCLNDWLQKNDNCPICRQEFGINQMIEYIVSKKLELIQDQTQKDRINSNKEQLLSKFQKVEIFELEGQQFLNMIKKYLIEQLSLDQFQFEYEDQKEQQNVQKDKNKIDFQKIIDQTSFLSKNQSSQYSPQKFQATLYTESSPENNKDFSQFNLMMSLNQDYSNKHLNSNQKLQNQFCYSIESPKTPKYYKDLEQKQKANSKHKRNAYQQQSKFKTSQKKSKNVIEDNIIEEQDGNNNNQEIKLNFNLFKSNSENLLESNFEQAQQENILINKNTQKLAKLNQSLNS
ncbi:anaphase-promoting complex subunit 11 RING-H2 finger protein (macronuclear) [Tetrahymena thermophila SB210]|uniref:Anaphase-promoting complex subunit 11 RING-H2 finger protein n=1 Tax=Tetrahymena thermophila (strain SB210) TaxID=312017 RepID=I7MJH3_TETTS|nr:anaphase-promoting complex subunit 11 RING-H2 finger protein [Tetrahymena thermophila SB210]EAS06275.2 anaphase-promoting complex subunit 11 RING-H2 finger protein [Tetrahymena thermophila SB210]|eukprot:XP_001026520.2 anaphase-promoting complex subunit 11 RING-H2 finger protein [Tetrahymena thermophila SB210]